MGHLLHFKDLLLRFQGSLESWNFFLPASSLKLQICTRSAWSRKNWAIGVRIVVRVRKLPILHLTSPKRRSSLGKWHNRLDRLVLRKWGTANSVFSPLKWSTSDSCNFCDIQSKAKNDIGVPNWMIFWTNQPLFFNRNIGCVLDGDNIQYLESGQWEDGDFPVKVFSSPTPV